MFVCVCIWSPADDTRFWWFEVWDLGRKLFLTSVISLLAKTGANRIIAGLLVLYVAVVNVSQRARLTVFALPSVLTSTCLDHVCSLIYLSVMLFYQPYKERSDSALAGVTQIQLFVTLFCMPLLSLLLAHVSAID